jgi:hypothetical protein
MAYAPGRPGEDTRSLLVFELAKGSTRSRREGLHETHRHEHPTRSPTPSGRLSAGGRLGRLPGRSTRQSVPALRPTLARRLDTINTGERDTFLTPFSEETKPLHDTAGWPVVASWGHRPQNAGMGSRPPENAADLEAKTQAFRQEVAAAGITLGPSVAQMAVRNGERASMWGARRPYDPALLSGSGDRNGASRPAPGSPTPRSRGVSPPSPRES